jgi:uncharacterized lipoprotein YddW (UPF0748 family)
MQLETRILLRICGRSYSGMRGLSTRLTPAVRRVAILCVAAACGGGAPTGPGAPVPPPLPGADPPGVAREFRGLWVATVANIDWPTQTGLTQSAALVEMRLILDRAQSLRMNAVIVQVRAAGDAIYPSPLEPWSRVLTGTQGIDPGWDPLSAWVSEAHQRGLELHAWFNPFRAGNVSDTALLAPSHLAKARPELARIAQGQLWFDPGEPEVRQRALDVILDVLTRYDVDGVHLDDYFYPYPLTGAPRPVQFPDDDSWTRYRAAGGPDMPRADWRRQNVDRFLELLYTEVHRVKPLARVGLSPFGIWRPGFPSGITGLDAWADIFADSRKWLENGWADYFAPQLYWSLSSVGQNFSALLDWWLSINARRRHLWPGLAAYRVADGTSSQYSAAEIVAQIAQTRMRAGAAAGGASGTLLYNTTSVRLNRGGLSDALGTAGYPGVTLVPAFTWLDATPPAAPGVVVVPGGSVTRVSWTAGSGESARWWLVQWRTSSAWNARLVWGAERSLDIAFANDAQRANVVVVTALDAAMNASPAAVWRAP